MSNHSTIARTGRRRRQTVLKTVRAGAARFTGHDRIELLALATELEDVQRDPNLTGPQKDARFKKIMNQRSQRTAQVL